MGASRLYDGKRGPCRPAEKTVKILSVNAGYLLDYDGSLGGYALRPHRAMVGSQRAERRATDRLVEVIAAERPDVVCLVEVDQGSVRTSTDGQVAHLRDRLVEHGLKYHYRTDTKYGDETLLANMPMLGHLSNGVLLRDGQEATAHYLDTGPKRLVNEVHLADDISLFVVHLAMSSRGRARQLRELAELVGDRERVVVAGDFNAYDGLEELETLTDATGLIVHNPGETVPKRPLDTFVTDTRTLDLFLTSPDIAVDRCEVLDVQISDHRPVVLEFEL